MQRGILIAFLLLVARVSCAQDPPDYLLRFYDEARNAAGFINSTGDTVIPPGKYSYSYTDTFRTYAIVLYPGKGWVGIDRQENILYSIYNFDNGPDYVNDGYFRIVAGNKIGFANAATGLIAIQPIYGCAWPFENGVAKVSVECHSEPAHKDSEYHVFVGKIWIYIDKQGKEVPAPGEKKED